MPNKMNLHDQTADQLRTMALKKFYDHPDDLTWRPLLKSILSHLKIYIDDGQKAKFITNCDDDFNALCHSFEIALYENQYDYYHDWLWYYQDHFHKLITDLLNNSHYAGDPIDPVTYYHKLTQILHLNKHYFTAGTWFAQLNDLNDQLVVKLRSLTAIQRCFHAD